MPFFSITLTDLLWLLVFALVHTVVSIIVHEAGHLLFGRLTGYRFVSFSVLSLTWAKSDGKVTFGRSKNRLMAGQCLMAPPEEEEKFRYGWYNLGGGLLNLVLAGALTPGLWAQNRLLYLLCLMGMAVNLAQAIVNLVPMDLGIPNDGLNALTASRSAMARRGLWLMLKVNDEVQQGKRYRDYAEEDFAAEGEADPKNYLEVYLLILQAARLEDLGEQEAAVAVFDGLDLNRVSSYYATSIRIDLMYYYSMYSKEYDKAREIFSMKKVQQLLKNQVPTLMRVRAAYLFFVLAMPGPGREQLEKARTALEEVPSLGMKAMETDAMDELAEAMEASEQNSLD